MHKRLGLAGGECGEASQAVIILCPPLRVKMQDFAGASAAGLDVRPRDLIDIPVSELAVEKLPAEAKRVAGLIG